MTKRAVVAALAGAVAAALGTVAVLAFWSTGGGGSASATGGSLQPVTVISVMAGDGPSSWLLPGTAGDVFLRVSNQNAFAVTLTSATFSAPISVNGGSGCTSANAGVSFTDQTALTISVPPGTSVVHLPGAAFMSTGSASGCQGASFSIPVSITVRH